MKTYKFIKGWMTGGTLTILENDTTFMRDKHGNPMEFRQIKKIEIDDMLRSGMLTAEL